ncbi:T9SS type A sorting domain-containing protein [Planktosalinus lacus]|uniref:Secretion system C-terminal sorting domain-containing protein n=1 Tax=Planktosalinus lacus TaxID=1526573 RepID=A0A8J2V7W1_9FLAO|nr:T9SS type A sorting domain-containing protein [Planktosalinus lacus]GGD85499.1 hypothetical protein GCM10011312_06920 [Planktosalinus lacus]
MKKLILIFFLLPFYCWSQQFETPRVIYEGSYFRYAIAADFDYDGHLDVAFVDDEILAWCKNVNGLGNFSEPFIVREDSNIVYQFSSDDIDNDGFIDILVAYGQHDEFAWHKNDGAGNFGPAQIIFSDLNRASSIQLIDMGQDGSKDLLLGITNGNGLYWAENLNNLGTLWELHTIDPNISQARVPSIADLDQDGDIDFLEPSGALGFDWFENTDGNGLSWTRHQNDLQVRQAHQLLDIDGDGFLDIITGIDRWLYLYKNQGNPNDFNIEVIHESVDLAQFYKVHVADLNNDGYNDIIAATHHAVTGDKLVWFENLDGLGNFGPQQIIDDDRLAIWSIETADFDSDGDLDILITDSGLGSTGPETRKLLWYRNNEILSIDDIETNPFKISPNPVREVLKIESSIPITQVTFYNIQGQIVLKSDTNQQAIDVSSFSNGVYFAEIKAGELKSIFKIIKE